MHTCVLYIYVCVCVCVQYIIEWVVRMDFLFMDLRHKYEWDRYMPSLMTRIVSMSHTVNANSTKYMLSLKGIGSIVSESKRQSQSQNFLLQQNEYHMYNSIRDWNPFGVFCLLRYEHYSYRTWPHFGNNKVSTGASTESKRSPKAILPVEYILDRIQLSHAKSQCSNPCWKLGNSDEWMHLKLKSRRLFLWFLNAEFHSNLHKTFRCTLSY